MITVKLMGGLGNQMFQYAVAKQLAIKNNTDVIFDLTFLQHRLQNRGYVFRDYDLDIFSDIEKRTTLLSRVPVSLRNPAYVLRTIINKTKSLSGNKKYFNEKKPYEFDSVIPDAGPHAHLSGYWQNERYFHETKEIIRRIFSTFSNPLSDKASELIKKIQDTNAVCINFRRTDYVSNTDNQKFFGGVTNTYYDDAVHFLTEKIQRPELFVFSDDIEWCKKNFKSTLPITFVGKEYAGPKYSDYLRLMMACKYFIIPNSTFAWWAAWLSPSEKKIVIAPKEWTADPSIDSNDMVPSEWVRM